MGRFKHQHCFQFIFESLPCGRLTQQHLGGVRRRAVLFLKFGCQVGQLKPENSN